MMKIDISIQNFEEVQDLLDAYPERVANASVRSINRVAKGMRTDATKSITSKYVIKRADVKTAVGRTLATARYVFANVNVSNRKIPLDKFRHTPSILGARKPKEGVKVYLRRSGAEISKGSFLGMSRKGKQKGETNGLKLFARKGGERLPIERLFSPAIYEMLDQSDIKNIQLSAKERYFKVFGHEMTKGFKHTGKGRK